MENWIHRTKVLEKLEDDYGIMILEAEKAVTDPRNCVRITKEEIVQNLNGVAKLHGVDMNEPDNWGGNITFDENFDVEARMKEFHKHLEKSRFKFHEIDYRYYGDCIKIYKEKLGKFCMIARMLSKDFPEDKKLLEELDIKTTEREVLERDVHRLFRPLAANYIALKKHVEKANDPNTYLNRILNETAMNMDGVSYYEVLPSRNLLASSGYIEATDGTEMQLTDQQKAVHEAKEKEAFKAVLKYI